MLPIRKNIRKADFDYSSGGLYFITVCCCGKQQRFGSVHNGVMCPNNFGKIAQSEWLNLQTRYEYCEPEIFQLMPDHIHGIIRLSTAKTNATQGKLGTVIGGYKSIVAYKCLSLCKEQNIYMGPLWQRGYHDRIIKSYSAYESAVEYIINNPRNW